MEMQQTSMFSPSQKHSSVTVLHKPPMPQPQAQQRMRGSAEISYQELWDIKAYKRESETKIKIEFSEQHGKSECWSQVTRL